MRSAPSEPNPELEKLLKDAQNHDMSQAESLEQKVSFVSGCLSEETRSHIVRKHVRESLIMQSPSASTPQATPSVYSPIDFDAYQTEAKETVIYSSDHAVTYPILGLVGEAGELANKHKKNLRDGVKPSEFDAHVKSLTDELGDCLWYIAIIARDLDTPLSVIARHNLVKLASRKARGTLGGSGDDR